MAIKISIETDNAAFSDDGPGEVARILRAVAERLEGAREADFHMVLRDINGNRVGECEAHIHPDDEDEECEPDPCPIHRQPVNRCPSSCEFHEGDLS